MFPFTNKKEIMKRYALKLAYIYALAGIILGSVLLSNCASFQKAEFSAQFIRLQDSSATSPILPSGVYIVRSGGLAKILVKN
jgi:hypothetical protein